MRYLFQEWEALAAEVSAAAHTILLSDYDGTLTPIVSRPEEALLPLGVRDKLRSLAGNRAFSIGIISGRPLAEVKSMVGIQGIYYAGNHGLEIEGPDLNFIHPAAKTAQPEIRGLYRQFSTSLAGIDGVIVEDKGLSLSVHYRLVKDGEVDTVKETFRELTSGLQGEGKIKVTSGKKVLEVRPPVDWHKGKAVETITAEIKAVRKIEEAPVIYLGDDTTDEDAFRITRRPQGWSIFVSGENTSSGADYFLNSTGEVEELLSRLLEIK